jgi:hypothetical protein
MCVLLCLFSTVADSVLEDRYEGHPQLQKLIQLKDKQVGAPSSCSCSCVKTSCRCVAICHRCSVWRMASRSTIACYEVLLLVHPKLQRSCCAVHRRCQCIAHSDMPETACRAVCRCRFATTPRHPTHCEQTSRSWHSAKRSLAQSE